MRGLLNGSTLIAPMVTMKDHLLIQMTLDQANTTFRVILERDPNIQWEIRERMDLSIRTLVLLIIILWTVWHMKTLLTGDSLKALLELSLIKIKLMLLKEEGMIQKTISILIFSTQLVIWKDQIKFQRIKGHSQLPVSITSRALLVKMLLNTL